MALLLILFGLFSGCLLAVLVGFLGRERNIGFGWSFVLSLIFTPLVGLIITLLSDKKPVAATKSWGCLGSLLGFFVAVVVLLAIFFCLALLA